MKQSELEAEMAQRKHEAAEKLAAEELERSKRKCQAETADDATTARLSSPSKKAKQYRATPEVATPSSQDEDILELERLNEEEKNLQAALEEEQRRRAEEQRARELEEARKKEQLERLRAKKALTQQQLAEARSRTPALRRRLEQDASTESVKTEDPAAASPTATSSLPPPATATATKSSPSTPRSTSLDSKAQTRTGASPATRPSNRDFRDRGLSSPSEEGSFLSEACPES